MPVCEQASTARALLVAVGQYDFDDWRDLDLVRHDIAAVTGALPDEDFAVQSLIDPDAATLKTHIQRFFSHCAREDDRLFFYFVGHGYSEVRYVAGSESPSAFLVARDTPYPTQQPQYGLDRRPPMEDTAVSVEWLTREAWRSRASDVLVVLDTCHVAASAAGVRISNARYATSGDVSCKADTPGSSLKARTTRQLGARNVITSGYGLAEVAANEAFAMAFSEALERGRADGYISAFNPKGVEDGRVDAKELVNYVHDRIQHGVARPQTPQIFCVGEKLFAFTISGS